MNTKLTFGTQLRTLRRLHELDLADLAEAAGLSVSYLSEIERGVRNPPTTACIAAMLERMGESAQLGRMQKLAVMSRKSVEIPVSEDFEVATDMLVALQRKVNDCTLSEDMAQQILALLQGAKKR